MTTTTVAKTSLNFQGCALAEPGGPWRLTFALGRLENLRFFIQIICWAPQILQFQSTGLPLIFLRAHKKKMYAGLKFIAVIPCRLICQTYPPTKSFPGVHVLQKTCNQTVSRRGRAKQCTKSVKHVQSCCFAETLALFLFAVLVAVVVA